MAALGCGGCAGLRRGVMVPGNRAVAGGAAGRKLRSKYGDGERGIEEHEREQAEACAEESI